METMDTHFKLRVTDDGRGMPINQARSGPKAVSFGVEFRLREPDCGRLGGTLEIHSSSATGGPRYYVVCRTSTLSRSRERDSG